ncbi:anti-sigma factor FlgM [Campylobacter lanienae NCTC 13004]|uniref:Anti-sigma factor FlgM n=1 Tax=Campylobacter lanienae NCTC 13004 TaxID=1031753 RepID=A0A1X9SLW1_9BACT|nr:flagellar biosynthesis anti-sigma factor FlgM [Campylobacter lanienae]ARQ97223.1 anti-sigma factor FlgM [Campylobacter lanienae NCTC 13004]
MIGSIKAGAIYNNNVITPKNEDKKNQEISQTQSSNNSRIKELAAQIKSGEYKVDINALSEKIADSLI